MNPPSDSVRAALVTVGDELLLGRTVDTNAAWLGRELAALGVPIARRHTVADLAPEIRRAVQDALEVAELVVVTGGLGPTPDDLTRDVVADLLGRPLRVDPDVLEEIRTRFRDRGVEELPAPNRRVAEVPEGARKIPNPVGTAPGLALETDGDRLRGAPSRGAPGDEGDLLGGADAVAEGTLRSPSAPRAHADPAHHRHPRIPPGAADRASVCPEGTRPVGLAFLPDEIGVDLRLTATDMAEEEALRRFDALESALADVLEEWRFEAAEGDLVEAVTAALVERRRTVAFAESCTGGLVAKRMTDRAGASQVVRGGVVAYADEVKVALLGVRPADLAAYGAVSEPVARRMALGVAEALGTDAGVGITGVAGPEGGTADKPVGTVWYAAALDGRVVSRRERFPGDRRSVRERSAQAALLLLLRLLEGRVPPEADTRDPVAP